MMTLYGACAMAKVRIGYVEYLNTAPLVEGLGAWRDAELVPAVPARLIGMLERREIDVGLASIIDAVARPVRPVVLPVGMIGCDGPTLTVRLFSRVALSDITCVHADTESHTSTALMQVILHGRHGVRARVEDYDAGVGLAGGERPEAVLLIGDKVVASALSEEEYPHQLDLGEAWKGMTGLPFVYAAWMCREGEEGDPAVVSAAEVLDRARRHNEMRSDWVVARRARGRGWPVDRAAEYVGRRLRYDLGEAERVAVDRFVEESARLGIVADRPVKWAELPLSASRGGGEPAGAAG